ncbi:ABC transporter permease [Candidatus Bipolaricaulota bacterium]|nr:ABC transporter permease [Candidatus Bipolaricaulota bacterium]
MREERTQILADEKEFRSQTQWQMIWRAFRRNRVAQVGLAGVIIVVLMAVFANFLAPYHYALQMRGHVFSPPTRIRIFDQAGNLTWPFVYATERRLDRATFRVTHVPDTTRMYPIRFFVRGPDTHRILGIFSTNLRLFGVGEFGNDPRHRAQVLLFGADSLGRCIFSRILYGSRVSLLVGPLVVLLITPVALLIGGISGFFGGVVDTVAQRTIEVVIALPGLPFLLAMAMVLRPFGLSPALQLFGIVAILAAIGWGGMARIVRGMVMSLREREFTIAAQAIGASPLRIIVRHIAPNLLTYFVVSATLTIPGMIIWESALSFLGFGIQEPGTSWGLLITDANRIVNIEMHPWVLIPGFMIFFTVLAFNFVGDALRDAVDPFKVV